jgi:hypothetical protein
MISAVFFDSQPKGTSTSTGVGDSAGVGTWEIGVRVVPLKGVAVIVLAGVMVELPVGVDVADALIIGVVVTEGVT